jgi:hypothetical protein
MRIIVRRKIEQNRSFIVDGSTCRKHTITALKRKAWEIPRQILRYEKSERGKIVGYSLLKRHN